MRRGRHHRDRKTPRLRDWDYRTPGWYFITIVTKDRRDYFGEIREGIMGLTELGSIAYRNWNAIPDHHNHIKLDEFIIMPNHVHGLVGIMEWPVKSTLKGTRDLASPTEEDLASPTEEDLASSNKEEMTSQRDFGPLQSGSISAVIHSYKASVTRWARKQDKFEFGWQSRFYDHVIRNERERDRIRTYIYNNPLKWSGDRYYE